jgi:DNA-binding HxlR family transcriptional regulator
LTLLYVAGSMDREGLLELLEADLGGVPPPVPDEEEVAAYEEELEAEEEELEEEGELADEELDPGLHAPMQATSKGEEMLFVAGTIERWLARCPQGPLELGLAGARALAPMVCSWSATLTHALAPGPLTLEELEHTLVGLDPETVEHRLESMVNSGQAEALFGSGRAPGYSLTDWGREAISPIVAAVRYELRYPEDDVLAPDVFDAEAAFQMALPLISVPPELRGACRAGVRIAGEEELVAGSTIEVEGGRVAASSPLLDRVPETWATGTALDWCETVIDPLAAKLDLGGDIELARGLIEALHERLFGDPLR